MKNLLICKKKCPIVAERDHEIACLKQELNKAHARINILIAGKRDNEVRIQRAKEALFSLPDSPITGGP